MFPLGQLLITPGALEAFKASGEDPLAYVVKHITLNPGDLCKEDVAENELSIREGFRVLSAYTLNDGQEIYVITEADRSCTTVLLRSEY